MLFILAPVLEELTEMQTIHTIDTAQLPEKIKAAEAAYHYQQELTKELDFLSHSEDDFTAYNLLQIVLWKLNRYPKWTDSLLSGINDLRREYSPAKARETLLQLLATPGFNLPMASAVLRFACPHHLAIIDQRVYRIIHPEGGELAIPYNDQAKANLYFAYIEQLQDICASHNIPFDQADRILYELDRAENSAHPPKHYGSHAATHTQP